ncbi:hypothetical protein [Leclercia sp.]|uniref:hypothetical protein n=1 Tax=Leclercia sp. TaxID=1898428 RepID=UPI0028A69DEB|nr:hypothetical protein [Leclercia sp.]
MKLNLKFPLGVYISVFVLLALITFIWDQVETKIDQDIIKYLAAIFVFATALGLHLIRKGTFDLYKNILNAIWNIETAFVFIYAVNYFIEHTPISKNESPFYEWSLAHPLIFSVLIAALTVVCVSRAGFSLAEIFKNSVAIADSTETPPSEKSEMPIDESIKESQG